MLMQEYSEKEQVGQKEIDNLHLGEKKKSVRKFNAALKACGKREPIAQLRKGLLLCTGIMRRMILRKDPTKVNFQLWKESLRSLSTHRKQTKHDTLIHMWFKGVRVHPKLAAIFGNLHGAWLYRRHNYEISLWLTRKYGLLNDTENVQVYGHFKFELSVTHMVLSLETWELQYWGDHGFFLHGFREPPRPGNT